MTAETAPATLIRRSELTCPGHSLKMMTKAAASEADEVIFDLEDGCAVSQKEGARHSIVEALTTLDFGQRMRAFRPNGPDTRFFYRDIIEVVEAAGQYIDSIVLPKINRPEDVLFADRLLTQIEQCMSFPVGRIQLEALIETAEGVLHAEAIAKSSPRLSSLIFGLLDFAGDIGAKETGAEQFFYYNYAKAKIVTAARAANLNALDGVTIAIKDQEALKRDAEMAARMGFDGKWAVYPPQVAIINAAFTPTAEEIARAQRIMDAYASADTEHGIGALVIDDEMIDAASLRVEERRLAIARRAGLIH